MAAFVELPLFTRMSLWRSLYRSGVHRLSHLKQPALSAGHRHLSDYPTPSLLYGLWGFGSLGGIGLQVQIVTGILLAMHYTPHVVCAGVSIEHILREVYGGWMLRHAHANGASLFFIAVGLHLFRGLAMGHAWRVFVWCLGVLLLLLSILTAFVGYVLPCVRAFDQHLCIQRGSDANIIYFFGQLVALPSVGTRLPLRTWSSVSSVSMGCEVHRYAGCDCVGVRM